MSEDVLEALTFAVKGVAIPQGSKTVFRGRAVDANKKLKPWRAIVKAAASDARADRPSFSGPVSVTLNFYLPRPASVRRVWPSVRPDIDKLTRAIFDSLTDAKVWADDGQVVGVHAHKFYADFDPGVIISVRVQE